MHAGSQLVPAPAQAAANNFITAVAPSLNDVTNSLIALIPSPPPPPPPPTVIQALAPLEEVMPTLSCIAPDARIHVRNASSKQICMGGLGN